MSERRAKGEYEPNRTIRMGSLWDRLGEVYGPRQRAAVIEQCVAYLLREPGAKLPPRAPQPPPED